MASISFIIPAYNEERLLGRTLSALGDATRTLSEPVVLSAVATPLYRMVGLASGCFLFCTSDAFHAAGGFDEALFGAEEAAISRALRRQGRFVVLRESVTTSGRKLRTYSGREVLGLLARLALAGPKAVRRRNGLEMWYGERRADPESDT